MLATPGLVDETWIHWVPTLPGRGETLFEGAGDELIGLKLVKTVRDASGAPAEFAR